MKYYLASIFITGLQYMGKFNSIEHFQEDLEEYMEYYYNKRIKLHLKGLSTAKYRAQSL